MSKCISVHGEYSEHEYTSKPICDYCGQISEMLAIVQNEDFRAALVAIQELHKPVVPVFSWQKGLTLCPPCPDCNGKAGMHECGCWADKDTEYECSCCNDFGNPKRTGVPWPCATRKLADEGLTDRIARTNQGGNNE